MITNQLFAIRIVEPSYIDERGFFHPEIVRIFFSDIQQKIRYAAVDGLVCKIEIENAATRPIVSIEGIGYNLTQQLPLGTRIYHFLPNGVHSLAAIINGPLPEKFCAQSLGRSSQLSPVSCDSMTKLEEVKIRPLLDEKLKALREMKNGGVDLQ